MGGALDLMYRQGLVPGWTDVLSTRGGHVLVVRAGVAQSTRSIGETLAGVVPLVTLTVLIDLRFAVVEQDQKTRIITIVAVIYEGVDQVVDGHAGSSRKIGRIPPVQGHGVGAVLQEAPGGDGQIGGRAEIGTSQHEVAIDVGAVVVQVNCSVRGIAVAVEQHDNQSIQGRVACAPIEKFYKLESLRTMGIYLIDENRGLGYGSLGQEEDRRDDHEQKRMG